MVAAFLIFWRITVWRFSVKIDLICLPTPNHHYENDRNWILLLWTFHQNHRFCSIFTMCHDTFSEKSLFHFEPSQVTFKGILSSMLGCWQARHVFIFPRNTTWPKNDALLRRKTCALLRAKTSALLRRKTCAVLRPLPKIRPDLSPARPDVSSDRKSKEHPR